MSENFELFVEGSSIIKLDCFEFLPEIAERLEGVRGYVSHPSLKLIFLKKNNVNNELPVFVQKWSLSSRKLVLPSGSGYFWEYNYVFDA